MSQNRLTSFKTEDLTCPKCGKVHALKKYSVINVTEKTALKEEIIKNRLFHFACDACDFAAPLTYDCVVIDSKSKLVLGLSPQMSPEFEKELLEYKIPGYKKRLVDNVNDLKEKLMIADNGLDDRVIEIVKLQYVGQLKDQMADDVLMDILFDYSDRKEYYLIVFFQKKGMGRIPLAFDFYRQTENQYASKIKAASKDDFMSVNIEWAGNLAFLRN